MRVFVDTNIYISYLLSTNQDHFIPLLFDKVADGEIDLLISEPLIDEIESTIKRKPHLLNTITETKLVVRQR